ncbi:MAG: glycosyltransferase family 4 protein [Planctomycetes bacterium]|nr:glycosyltransferase family 4 protein [Planctomycetota bacterium]
MRILLEGWELARTKDLGGVQSYWRQLVPAMLDQAAPDLQLVLLSAFLNPRWIPVYQSFRRRGAVLRHWWADPRWIRVLGRRGFRAEWFAGPHDLVHAPEPTWCLPGSGRLVVTCHDLMFHHHPQFLAPEWTDRLMRGMERCRRGAPSRVCASASPPGPPAPAHGVPPGRAPPAPPGRLAPPPAPRAPREGRTGAEPRDRRFLFLGSVEPKKNLGLLLRAFGLAAERGLRAGLDVAGRASWDSEAIRGAAERDQSLADRVRFLGFVDDAELPRRVADALALVLPSRFEGFGMPVVEAMAAGTPVLCSDRGALPEVAGGAARLFDADDAEGLAELLLQVEQDPDLRAGLRQAGLRRAADFSWRRCAADTLAAYRRAAELPR